jgi:hypothetical protein
MIHIVMTERKDSHKIDLSSKVVFQRFEPILRGTYTNHSVCVCAAYLFSYRHDDHFQVYKERCAKLGIATHKRATPKTHGIDRRSVHFSYGHSVASNGDLFSLTQTTLDSVVST